MNAEKFLKSKNIKDVQWWTVKDGNQEKLCKLSDLLNDYLSHTIAERLGDDVIQDKIDKQFTVFESKNRAIAWHFTKWASKQILKK